MDANEGGQLSEVGEVLLRPRNEGNGTGSSRRGDDIGFLVDTGQSECANDLLDSTANRTLVGAQGESKMEE